MELNGYGVAGLFLGWATGGITFLVAWIYCMSEYGFLFGFGLGWLPAAILAAIVGFVVRFLWGPILGLVAILALQLMD